MLLHKVNEYWSNALHLLLFSLTLKTKGVLNIKKLSFKIIY